MLLFMGLDDKGFAKFFVPGGGFAVAVALKRLDRAGIAPAPVTN